MGNYCDRLLDYVDHYSTANVAIVLKGHLNVCRSCQKNIDVYFEALILIQRDFPYICRKPLSSIYVEETVFHVLFPLNRL